MKWNWRESPVLYLFALGALSACSPSPAPQEPPPPKVTVAQVETYALGGGFELALMSDISVAGRDVKVGMPGARLLGPALGNLHLFFYRLGPVLARRLLLTGDVVEAGEIEHLCIFTEVCDPADVAARTERWAAKVARMPADGLAIAKTAFNLVEET